MASLKESEVKEIHKAVYKLIQDGRIRVIRKGRRSMFLRPSDVKRFAEIPRLTGAAGHKKNRRRRVDKCS
jgi:hypothetical protein